VQSPGRRPTARHSRHRGHVVRVNLIRAKRVARH
jgi:hypothetical protein